MGFSCPTRPLFSLMASATPRWWPSALARRVSSLVVPFCRVSRFPHGLRNIATTNSIKGDESGKQNRRLSISSANVITRSQNKHSTVTQGMKNVTSGRVLEVIAGNGKSDKDDCRDASEFIYDQRDTSGQIVKHTGYGEEDRKNATDNQRGEIVASNDKELSDDEEYTMDIILPKSRHCDGSIYSYMDRWWKNLFHIADRNENVTRRVGVLSH